MERCVKRSAEDWGDSLRARGGRSLSVLRTCVTKQTGDMRYSEAEPLWFRTPVLRTMMRYALESEFCFGSTLAVLVELSKGRDVGLQTFAMNLQSPDQRPTDGSTDIKKQARKVFST